MADKPMVPSPRPMPTTGLPDRNDPARNDLYPGMKAGMRSDRLMQVNPGRTTSDPREK